VLARLTGALVVACALLVAVPSGAMAKLSREPQKVYDDYRSDAAIQPCDHTVAAYRRTLREITPAIEEETPAFRPAVEAALREREGGKQRCLKEDSPTQSGTSGTAGSDPTTGSKGGSGGTQTSPVPPTTAQPAPSAQAKPAPPAAPAPASPGATTTRPAPSATPVPTAAPAAPAATPAPAAPAPVVLLDHPYKGTPTGLIVALGLLALGALLAILALLARRFGWAEERLAPARHAWGEAAYRAGATWGDFVDWIRLGRGPHRL
jgi:hypothetical protein